MSDELPAELQQGHTFTAVLGALMGTLAMKGVLSRTELLAIFETADQMLPDSARDLGAETMTAIRDLVMSAVPDEPRDRI
ncbi:hypothetical protein [Roseomonas marmotae]|uniref:Uncharacterized protein n=1 Tax=Roseomonas marmotae TaxID=2768161 RepID=A0ABS3K8I7_9PROT|nr:hypothetical protein [Roseomonas marmotae]MBO1073786.1 hypothetical protein [Roseomonas marmotae]QTI78584.1 hypothetical protein IAI58_12990 [Roseomonas marmotae]